ncbi:arginine kinase [Ostertagia ostertagi]
MLFQIRRISARWAELMWREQYAIGGLHCAGIGDATMSVPPEIIKKIEDGYQTLQNAKDCHSLLKKYLTKDVVDQLKGKRTKLGATLWDVIQSGVANLDSGVGVYAPDAEAYTLFKPLFDPLIQDYHNGFSPSQKQPATDLGEGKTAQLVDLDPEGKYINSTRVRCGRSLQGYPFNPCLTEANYLEMEAKVKKIFENINDPELQGTYYPLDGMTKEVQNQLIKDHFLFKEGDRFLQAANACRYWPKGRGIFHNKNKTFLVWANEEDHLRIISMQNGGNVGQVLERLIKGVKTIQAQAPFSRDDRLGWLTFCPSNLGTTVRASVHIRLPKISAKPDFKKICDELKLQIRGIHGEHSDSEGGVYDISNKARLGLTEFEAVKQMYDGVKHLIELEKKA